MVIFMNSDIDVRRAESKIAKFYYSHINIQGTECGDNNSGANYVYSQNCIVFDSTMENLNCTAYEVP